MSIGISNKQWKPAHLASKEDKLTFAMPKKDSQVFKLAIASVMYLFYACAKIKQKVCKHQKLTYTRFYKTFLA